MRIRFEQFKHAARACAMLPVLMLAGLAVPAPLAVSQAVKPAEGLTHQVFCSVDLHVNLDGAPQGFRGDVLQVVEEAEQLTGIEVQVMFDLRSKDRAQPAAQPGVTVVNVFFDYYDPARDVIQVGPRSLWGLADTKAALGRGTTSVVLLNSLQLEPFTVTLSGQEQHFSPALLPGAPTRERPFRVVSLFRHEFGHVLGLPHADRHDQQSTMTAQPNVFRGRDAWSADAAATLADGYMNCRGG